MTKGRRSWMASSSDRGQADDVSCGSGAATDLNRPDSSSCVQAHDMIRDWYVPLFLVLAPCNDDTTITHRPVLNLNVDSLLSNCCLICTRCLQLFLDLPLSTNADKGICRRDTKLSSATIRSLGSKPERTLALFMNRTIHSQATSHSSIAFILLSAFDAKLV